MNDAQQRSRVSGYKVVAGISNLGRQDDVRHLLCLGESRGSQYDAMLPSKKGDCVRNSCEFGDRQVPVACSEDLRVKTMTIAVPDGPHSSSSEVRPKVLGKRIPGPNTKMIDEFFSRAVLPVSGRIPEGRE